MHPIPVVRLIVPDAQGRVLMLRRQRNTYAAGAWCLPGGKVDYKQTVLDAVEKELCEETSLACTSAKFLFYQDSLPLAPGGMHCINLYFECTVSGNIMLNRESAEHAWIGPADLGKYEIAFRNDLALIRYWQEKTGTDPTEKAQRNEVR